jgi:diacylglycerol kinase (ATP)
MTAGSSASVRFLVNPAAGRGQGMGRLDLLCRLAAEAGAGLAVSRSGDDVTEQARRAVADGIGRLVVAGGDGTVQRAVQGLAGTSCALGVVPLGTGNDLAATFAIPRDPAAAVARALGGAVRAIDLIRIRDSWSAAYAGVGFDSEVTACANAVRRLRGPIVYVYAVVRTLARFVPPAIRVEHDGGVYEGRAMFAIANNLPRLGGGMRIAPAALPDDGLLDLVIVDEVGKLELLRIFPQVYSGRHVGHPAVTLVRTAAARITLDRPMTMFAGGEPMHAVAAGEPSEVAVVPGALQVVAG